MKISVIIPVFHEEKYINFCIRNLLKKLRNSIFEIIVVDSSINKSTLEAINEYHVDVKKIYSEKGRGRQLNAGAKIAGGDILLFIHADTILPENAEELIKNNLSENTILSFSLGIYDKKIFFRIIEFFGKLRCKISKVPYGDQCFVMKKEVFYIVGGFSEDNLEDVKFIKKAKKIGINVKILNAKVKTSPRRWYREGFLRTTLKNRVKILKFILKNSCYLIPTITALISL